MYLIVENLIFPKIPTLYMDVRYLDEKIKLVWMMPTAFFVFIVWFIVTVAVFGLYSEDQLLDMPKTLFVFLFSIFSIVLVLLPIYFYSHIEYMSFTYELAENEFIIRQGVITRHTTVIPYNRIQNISTTRTLLERILGLATLQIETAGTNPLASEGVLPGVSKKDILISEIMMRVERLKKHDSISKSLPQPPKSERELLGEILKELHELNNSLHTSSSKPVLGDKSRMKWEHVSPEYSTLHKDEHKKR